MGSLAISVPLLHDFALNMLLTLATARWHVIASKKSIPSYIHSYRCLLPACCTYFCSCLCIPRRCCLPCFCRCLPATGAVELGVHYAILQRTHQLLSQYMLLPDSWSGLWEAADAEDTGGVSSNTDAVTSCPRQLLVASWMCWTWLLMIARRKC